MSTVSSTTATQNTTTSTLSTTTPSVAASIAPFTTDNYTARASTSAYQVPESSIANFNQWLADNANVKWYAKNDGVKQTYISLAANEPRPADAVPVTDSELHIVYASLQPSLQQSLVDHAMARALDEQLQAAGFTSVTNSLRTIPEVNVNADLSSLSQDELLQLLKQLVQVGQSLKTVAMSGDLADQQSKALQLGFSVEMLTQALALQATFDAESQAMQEAYDAQTEAAAKAAAEAAAKAAEDGSAAPQPTILPPDPGSAADNPLMEAFRVAISLIVADASLQVEIAQSQYAASATAVLTPRQLSDLTSTSFSAFVKSLQASADLGFLATSAELQFGKVTDVVQTENAYVLSTSAGATRNTQIAAVQAQLEQAISDPAVSANFADALAANADSLGTADIAQYEQTQLYNALTAAITQALLANPEALITVASGAVDAGNRFFELLTNDYQGAESQDAARSEQFS